MSVERADRVTVLVHELRSPVAALSAVAGAARDVRGEERAELTRLAIGACAAVERLVSDIAVASVRRTPTDVGALVHDSAAARRLAGARVAEEVDPDLPLVDVDPVRLRQILDNLIGNALLHADAGTIIVRAMRPTVTEVAVVVEDDGEGIDPDVLDRIFEPGVRLDPRRPGSGLGLSLTRALVEAHGGRITVESTRGSGSSFTVTLPVRAQPPTRASSV